MRFHPSEEQQAIHDALRGTLADNFPAERLRGFLDEEADFDRASWDALMALGLGGLALPEAAGGSGLGLVDLAMAVEALGEGAAPGPLIQHLVAGLCLSRSSNEAAKAKWLAAVASGATVATLAWGGKGRIETWPVALDGDLVSGKVRFVVGARAAQLFVVGVAGGGLALVEAGPGVEIEPLRSSDRTRPLSSVSFEGVRAELLFAPGDSAGAAIYDAALVLMAADALGGAQYCVDLSVGYAKEREQFGQPIGRFQALKHQLATMALEVEPAHALLWYAGYAWDAGLADASRAAALAKAHIADRFVSVARAAVAAHGGIGYSWEYGLSAWFRRSLFDRAYLGSPALHRARAAELAGW